MGKFSQQINNWLQSLNTKSTRRRYRDAVKKFAKYADATIQSLKDMPLEQIERKMTEFIHSHKGTLAPKYLNLIYCAVKDYCRYFGLIKSTLQFKQIKFDKASRSTRDARMLKDTQFKALFDHANIKEKSVISLFGIHGLRESLIPQLTLANVLETDINLETLELKDKTWIWVWKEYVGNKGNVDFPVVLTKETADWISKHLSDRRRKGERITLKSKLVNVKDYEAVQHIVNKLYAKVGFDGRPYLLRHYADRLLRKACSDDRFKEWMMGHKGGVPEIYHHGHVLSDDEIAEFKAKIDETPLLVYGISEEETRLAKQLAKQIRSERTQTSSD